MSAPCRPTATCVLVGSGAVLIRGPSGCGKSTLAGALIAMDGPARPARLIGDDAVELFAAGGRLIAQAPRETFGRIEIRGVGVVAVPAERRAVVRLVVDLVEAEAAPRMPDEGADATVALCGVVVPRLALSRAADALAWRVVTALDAVRAGSPLPVLARRRAF